MKTKVRKSCKISYFRQLLIHKNTQNTQYFTLKSGVLFGLHFFALLADELKKCIGRLKSMNGNSGNFYELTISTLSYDILRKSLKNVYLMTVVKLGARKMTWKEKCKITLKVVILANFAYFKGFTLVVCFLKCF